MYLVSCMVMTQVLNAVLIVNRFMHCCYIFKTVCIWIIICRSMDIHCMCITVNVLFIFIKLYYLYISICIFHDKPVTDAVRQVLNPEYSLYSDFFYFMLHNLF